MREITSLAPSEIHIGDRLRRSLNRDVVDRLKQSIEKIGLKTPISVQYVSDEEGFLLVAGHHRLQACIELGWTDIPVREEGGSDLDARMWEIAENLHRADLTALERSEHIAEWIKLAEEREAFHAAQSAPHRKPGQQPGGINAASRELGIERTQAQRAVKVASLPESAKQAARETGVDKNLTALITAQKAPDPEAAIRRKAAEKDHADAMKFNREADRIVQNRRIEDITSWLAARLEVSEMHDLGMMLSGGISIAELSKALLREAA